MTKRRPLKERFYEKLPVDRDPDKCWGWKAGFNNKGYGQIGAGGEHGKILKAHRVAWELYNDRKIPEGMCVLHSCDNRSCCNPNHLRLGTPADNARDMVDRGRSDVTVPDWIAREALKFLKTGVTQKKVAEMLTKKGYPCDRTTISDWVRGKRRSAKVLEG